MLVKELGRGEGWSFWQVGGEVFRSRHEEPMPMDVFGQPMSKRWECSRQHWDRFRSVYSWVKDVPSS